MGFSFTNHQFWGTPIYGNPAHVFKHLKDEVPEPYVTTVGLLGSLQPPGRPPEKGAQLCGSLFALLAIEQ